MSITCVYRMCFGMLLLEHSCPAQVTPCADAAYSASSGWVISLLPPPGNTSSPPWTPSNKKNRMTGNFTEGRSNWEGWVGKTKQPFAYFGLRYSWAKIIKGNNLYYQMNHAHPSLPTSMHEHICIVTNPFSQKAPPTRGILFHSLL